jgi:hypothetical protein
MTRHINHIKAAAEHHTTLGTFSLVVTLLEGGAIL